MNAVLEARQERAASAAAGEIPFAQLECLSGLDAGELEWFRSLLERRVHTRGEPVVMEGDATGELFIIVAGRAAVHFGEPPVRVATLAPGAVFGEMSLLDGEQRSANVIVEEALVTYVLDRPAYERLVRERPLLAIRLLTNLARILSGRLRRANGMLQRR